MNLGYQFSRQSNRLTSVLCKTARTFSGLAGITGNNQDPTNWGPPTLNFSNAADVADGWSELVQSAMRRTGVTFEWDVEPLAA